MNLNKFLKDFHLEFSYEDVNNFYKECRANQILHSCDYKLKYQPTHWMYFNAYSYGYSEYSCKSMRFKGKKIKGYGIWMNIKEDYTGSHYKVFYPKKATEGKKLDIIYQGTIFNGEVNWEHSRRGLWDIIIYKIILMEAYYMSKNQKIVNWIYSNLNNSLKLDS